MSVDIAALIATPGVIAPILFGSGAAGALAMGAALAMPAVSRRLMPMPKESRLADFLPFDRMLPDGKTIETRRGDLVRIIALKGAELQVTAEGEHHSLFTARRTWLNLIAEKDARARVFTVRTSVNPHSPRPHPIPHLAEIAQRWEKSFEGNSFTTEHYIVLSVPKAKAKMVIEEVTRLTLDTLVAFGPKVLDHTTEESPLRILARLASPITKPCPKPHPSAPISELICCDAVEFTDDDSGKIIFRNAGKERHVAILGVKALGDASEEKMVADLASLPFDYTIFHNIEPLSRIRSKTKLDVARRLAGTTFSNVNSVAQFEHTNEIISGNEDNAQILCNYAFNLIVEGDSEADLEQRLSQINMIAAQYQVTLVREGMVAHATWFSMFPTYDMLSRPWLLLAANVSVNLALQKNSPGHNTCPWGRSPVTILRTATGNPYSFVFQDMSDPNNKEPLGHMLVVGPSGSGKTLTTSLLSTMAMRFPELRVFFFDRFYGTEVATSLSDGRYIRFDGTDAAMNPLQMELTEKNKEYLKGWLQLVTGLEDERSVEQFAHAIKMLEHTPLESRNLKQIQQIAFPPDSEARARIRPWTNDAAYGQYFCAPEDSMDLEARMIGFDFTTILDPERKDALGPAVVSYVMHRTMDVSVNRGYPAIYFVDETAPLLKNEYFAAKFAAGLQEGRKLGQIFICAFQRPNAIEESGHAQTILGQCATQLFFRNPKAKAEDFTLFNMTKRELDFVLGNSHQNLKRAFLMRRITETEGLESVIINADLSPLGDALTTFASGNAYVRLLQDAKRTHPDNWRQVYMQKAAALRSGAD